MILLSCSNLSYPGATRWQHFLAPSLLIFIKNIYTTVEASDPPPAYDVYALENVDNNERPLMWVEKINVHIQTE